MCVCVASLSNASIICIINRFYLVTVLHSLQYTHTDAQARNSIFTLLHRWSILVYDLVNVCRWLDTIHWANIWLFPVYQRVVLAFCAIMFQRLSPDVTQNKWRWDRGRPISGPNVLLVAVQGNCFCLSIWLYARICSKASLQNAPPFWA